MLCWHCIPIWGDTIALAYDLQSIGALAVDRILEEERTRLPSQLATQGRSAAVQMGLEIKRIPGAVVNEESTRLMVPIVTETHTKTASNILNDIGNLADPAAYWRKVGVSERDSDSP